MDQGHRGVHSRRFSNSGMVVVGYAAFRLSAEANGIQTSLARIGVRKRKLRAQPRREQLATSYRTLLEISANLIRTTRTSKIIWIKQTHEGVIRLLGIRGSYNSLMKYVFGANNKGRFIEYGAIIQTASRVKIARLTIAQACLRLTWTT